MSIIPYLPPKGKGENSMFAWLKRNKEKSVNVKQNSKGALYIYKPYENAMAYRVEHRDNAAYVYRGWSKGWAFRVTENRVYAAGEENASYIIIEDKLCDAGSGKTLYKIVGERIYHPGDREACFLIKNTITVQGTL